MTETDGTGRSLNGPDPRVERFMRALHELIHEHGVEALDFEGSDGLFLKLDGDWVAESISIEHAEIRWCEVGTRGTAVRRREYSLRNRILRRHPEHSSRLPLKEECDYYCDGQQVARSEFAALYYCAEHDQFQLRGPAKGMPHLRAFDNVPWFKAVNIVQIPGWELLDGGTGNESFDAAMREALLP